MLEEHSGEEYYYKQNSEACRFPSLNLEVQTSKTCFEKPDFEIIFKFQLFLSAQTKKERKGCCKNIPKEYTRTRNYRGPIRDLFVCLSSLERTLCLVPAALHLLEKLT